ncbi:MAG: Glycerate kinase [Pedosphaera sp.]|nr:Glycerate kinase [Pedosphaera sp.]
MPLTVLIVPDKFKGSLTAQEAAEAIARGWRKSRRADTLELLPMSDGGDGFGEIISGMLDTEVQTVETVDAAHRPCSAQWWWDAKSKTAIIEAARINGLAKLPPGKFHPFDLDTFGLGAAIRAASAKGAKRCLIGIGGSATNDAGFGLARALGWEFDDAEGNEIKSWSQLHLLEKFFAPKKKHWFEETTVAVDVQNVLLGTQGCTRVYGPQKGLTKADFAHAEACLRRLAMVSKRDLTRDYASEPGAGAAGGLGFGLRCFLGARLQAGFDVFTRHAKLGSRIHAADVIITGEGAIDKSTLMGKGVGQIAQWCRKLKQPCIGLAGMVANQKQMNGCFTQTHGMTDITTEEKAKAKPAEWLGKLAEEVARGWVE